MFHYRCPRCDNVSDEGFAIIGGPECVRCGTEMRPAGIPGNEDRRDGEPARQACLRESADVAGQGD